MGAVVYALRPLFQAGQHLDEARRLVDAARGRAESDRRGTLSLARAAVGDAYGALHRACKHLDSVTAPRVRAAFERADALQRRVLAGQARIRLRRLPAVATRPANDVELETPETWDPTVGGAA